MPTRSSNEGGEEERARSLSKDDTAQVTAKEEGSGVSRFHCRLRSRSVQREACRVAVVIVGLRKRERERERERERRRALSHPLVHLQRGLLHMFW